MVVFSCSYMACAEADPRADARVEQILTQMTLDEKIDYVGGIHYFNIRGIPRLGVPEMRMADGPLGVKKSDPSIEYPCAICLASSFNPQLAEEVGGMLGYDARARGVHMLLGPGMNIYRSPLCGRNFEYLGEDPYAVSRMAVGLISGIQSQGVIATAKHFAGNNQEWDRHHVSSDIDERTLREIYLPAFEASVKEANVGAIMTSYNYINGVHASEYQHLNIEIAKKEWGFRGFMVSDWGLGVYNGVQAANGGLDLEMPYGQCMSYATLANAIQNGSVTADVLTEKVRRILRTANQFGFLDRPQAESSYSLLNTGGRAIALKAAIEGMVLLKNESVLPLKKDELKSIAIIGPCAQDLIPQGGGSSKVSPVLYSSFLAGISEAVGPNTKVYYSRGVPDIQNITEGTQFTTTAQSNVVGLVGEYFDNPNLEGTTALVRTDSQINFRWKENSYRGWGPVNNYSARWTGYFTPQISGEFTCYISAADGFRVYVDNKCVIDNWNGARDSLQYKTLSLDVGKHYKVVVEYAVRYGPQGIQFGITAESPKYIADACAVAAKADAVVLCVGFGSSYEGEDWDRTFALPLGQNALIQAVLATNKKAVVAVAAGGGIAMPWVDAAPALIYTWYPGQEGGRALSAILFGDANPSGKLPISFEHCLAENATYNSYYDQKGSKHVEYKEGIFLGYRHFDRNNIKPLFPFGFGLSYTTFEYGHLQVEPVNSSTVAVTFTVKNTGQRQGAEVAQVYVSDTHSTVPRPVKELKGFVKVDLQPGEEKQLCILLNERAFAYYNTQQKAWTVDPGVFNILLCSSAATIRGQSSFSWPITMQESK